MRGSLSLLVVLPAVAPAGVAGAAEPAPLPPEVVVHGERPSGYAVKGHITGSRAARPISDVPQSLTVVPRVLLEDTGARRVENALAMTPSVQLGAGFGLLWEDYFVRGSRVWSGTMYRNGYLSGYSGLSATDALGVERVEVLRGPAAALYGPGLPGGSINIVTLRPDARARTDVGTGIGTHGTQRATLDSTGPLSDIVSYRLTTSVDRTAGYRDFNEASRVVVNPVVVLTPSSRTRLLVETQLFRVRYRPDSRGVPVVNGDPFALPNERSLIEPDTPITVFDGVLTRAEMEHRASPELLFRVGVQRQAAIQDERATVFLGLRADGETLDRLPIHYFARSGDVALQAGLEWKPMTGPVRHDIVLGADLRHEEVGWRIGAAADVFPIDLFDPVYGGPPPAVVEQTGPDNEWTYADAGLYVNDVVHLLPSLRVVLGGRVDVYEQTSVAPIAAVDEAEGEIALSGRAGLLYDFTTWLSTYASVSRGFWPVLGVSADAKLLSPERSVGAEVGARLAAARDLATLDVALFQTWNHHITLPDPAAPDFQLQRDLAVSRGLELWGTVFPGKSFRLSGSYTLTDARVTEDADEALVDTPLPFVSTHAAGAFAVVTIPAGRHALEVGSGFRAVGERHLNDGTEVPGYGRMDASLSLRAPTARVQLVTENVLDTRYVQSGNDVSSVLFGAPRTFYFSVTATL